MDLPQLIAKFGTEDKCIEALAQLRWPKGVICPKCNSTEIGRVATRRLFQCNACDYQFSVRVGTVLQDSKLPLWKWFLATFLLIEAKKGMSANQLSRTLGVTTKTGWYLSHRIRAAMDPGDTKLSGIVEVDETYVGGKATRGSRFASNKTMILGAIERGGKVRFGVSPAPYASSSILKGFIGEHISDDAAAIYTDSHRGYEGIGDENTIHESVNHSGKEWVRGGVHTNTVESVWSLLDRAIIGSYHQLSRKHLPAYLDEFAFRFNNRDNPYKFRDTLTRLCQSDVLTYGKLVA